MGVLEARHKDHHQQLMGLPTDRRQDRATGRSVLSGRWQRIHLRPGARGYIDETVFAERGIKLTWFDYEGYPEYPQLWGDFTHGVSILDLLFNCGNDAPRYMRYVRA